MGDKINLSGDFRGAQLNIKSDLTNNATSRRDYGDWYIEFDSEIDGWYVCNDEELRCTGEFTSEKAALRYLATEMSEIITRLKGIIKSNG